MGGQKSQEPKFSKMRGLCSYEKLPPDGEACEAMRNYAQMWRPVWLCGGLCERIFRDFFITIFSLDGRLKEPGTKFSKMRSLCGYEKLPPDGEACVAT